MLQQKQQRESQSREKEQKEKKSTLKTGRRNAAGAVGGAEEAVCSCNPRRALGSSPCVNLSSHTISVNKCKWRFLGHFEVISLYKPIQCDAVQ